MHWTRGVAAVVVAFAAAFALPSGALAGPLDAGPEASVAKKGKSKAKRSPARGKTRSQAAAAPFLLRGSRVVFLSTSRPAKSIVAGVRAGGCARPVRLTIHVGRHRIVREQLAPNRDRTLRAPLVGARRGRHRVKLTVAGARARCAVRVSTLRIAAAPPRRPARAPAVAPLPDPLTAPKRPVPLAAAFDWRPNFWADGQYQNAFIRHFSGMTPENVMKMEFVQPERGRFDFFYANGIVDFAERYGKSVHGHTLIWHSQLPGWIQERRWNRDELTDVMREHIHTVVGYFRGRVREWDVVNEPLAEDGTMRQSVWADAIGPEYVERALRFAREADPSAKLFINDYDIEFDGPKADGMVKLVRDLQARGVPIDGVGIQMHWSEGPAPSPLEVTRWLKRFTDLGVEVQVTEMDVALNPAHKDFEEHRINQEEQYLAAALACNALPACSRFTVWGVSDRYTWRGSATTPLLLDREHRPKPVYGKVRDVFAPLG